MKTTKEFTNDVAKIAIPIGLQALVSNLVNIIDNIMVGELGESAMSAISVVNSFIIIAQTVTMSISGGALIIAAQEYGRKEIKNIKKLLSFCIAVGLVACAILFVIANAIPETIIRIYTPLEDLLEPACTYLSIICYSLFFNVISRGVGTLIRAVSDVKISLYASIAGCFANMIGNYCMIYGKFGFQPMGIRGAAIATCLARVVEALILVVYLLKFEKVLQFKITDFNPFIGKELLFTLAKITVPIFITDFLNNSSYSVQSMITGRTSKYYLSANSIVHNAWMLPNSFNNGVSSAASVLIGHSLGRGDEEEAKKDGKRFIWASLFFGAFCSVFVQIACPILSSFYTELAPETIEMVRSLSYCCSFIVLFNCMGQCLANGVIKAAGRTKELMILDSVTVWLMAIPISYIAAFKFNAPVTVLYILLRSQHIFKTVWSIIQLNSGKWINTIKSID